MLWHISKWLLSLPPVRIMRAFFFSLHHENLAGLLEVKLTKVRPLLPPKTGAPCSFNSPACPRSASSHGRFSTLVLVPVDVLAPRLLLWEAVALWILLSVSPIWGAEEWWSQNSVGSKRFGDFVCSAFFLVVKTGVMTSKFLIMSVQKLEVRTCDCFILAPLSTAMFIPGCSVATIPAAPYGQLWESCQPCFHFCTFDSSEH